MGPILYKKTVQINDESLRWIDSILNIWVDINAEYINQYDDCLYWYNERADVSTFSGAIWKAGGFAIEEYSSKKGDDESQTNGRVDLYFSIGDKEVVAEVKKQWLYFGQQVRLNLEGKINRVVSAAEQDICRSLHSNHCDVGLGLSFISTYWLKGYNATQDIESLKKIMKYYDCSFYVIFETEKDFVSAKGNIHNVAVLIGKAFR